jgi:hypothetical protein
MSYVMLTRPIGSQLPLGVSRGAVYDQSEATASNLGAIDTSSYSRGKEAEG